MSIAYSILLLLLLSLVFLPCFSVASLLLGFHSVASLLLVFC